MGRSGPAAVSGRQNGVMKKAGLGDCGPDCSRAWLAGWVLSRQNWNLNLGAGSHKSGGGQSASGFADRLQVG